MDHELKKGDIVRHFKGNFYEIEDIAEHTETGEKLVVYRALYGDGKCWCRPHEMFIGKVDRDKYPDVKQEYRFEKVELLDEEVKRLAAVFFTVGYEDGGVEQDMAAIYDADRLSEAEVFRLIRDEQSSASLVLMTQNQYDCLFATMMEGNVTIQKEDDTNN